MKKFLVLVMVLGMASTVNAQLGLSISGPDSLVTNATGTYTVSYSGATMLAADVDIVVDFGSIGGGVILTTNRNSGLDFTGINIASSNYEVAIMNDVAATDLGSPLFSIVLTAPSVVPAGNKVTISLLENSFFDLSWNKITGTVMPTKQVIISLAKLNVPNVVGMTQSAAETTIIGAGLTVGTVTQHYSDTVAAGNVISQDPVAGTAADVGSSINLVISLGESTTVPNVVGMTAADANAAITSVGLKPVNGGNEFSSTVAAGLVSSQIPAGSTEVNIGSTVTYKVSSLLGKPTVPNVVGMAASDANTAIINANLVVGAVTTKYSDTVDSGKVISQSPAAGKMVAIGSKVKYIISLGTKPIVPNVVGMTASDANTAIVDANLVVGTVTTKYSNTVDAGKVISQSPAAGRAVAIGSKVKYIISLGKKPIVPNGVVMVAPDANTAIVDANLVVGTVTTKYSNTVDAGKVISQSPAAGKAVAIGSKVKYVISLGKME